MERSASHHSDTDCYILFVAVEEGCERVWPYPAICDRAEFLAVVRGLEDCAPRRIVSERGYLCCRRLAVWSPAAKMQTLRSGAQCFKSHMTPGVVLR
eukprot:1978076-Amphidinium_carterae.1